MKCYFAFDEEKNQKVLIPGCRSVVHSNDIEDCTCQELTYSKFEKERYNKILNERNQEIKELRSEAIRLNNLLYKLKNNKQ